MREMTWEVRKLIFIGSRISDHGCEIVLSASGGAVIVAKRGF